MIQEKWFFFLLGVQCVHLRIMDLMVLTNDGCFVACSAILTGELQLGEGANFWFGAVVRGDVARIAIGRRVNVQDNATIHCDSGIPNIIEDDVTIGHGAVVHGQFIGAGSLVGMGAKLLGRTRLGRQCLVAAGAVVPPGLVVPDRMVVMGVPGRIARPVNEDELKYMGWLSGHYLQLAEKYVSGEIKPYYKEGGEAPPACPGVPGQG